MSRAIEPSVDELKRVFSFDPTTGVLTRTSAGYREARLVGKPAGSINNGYLRTGFKHRHLYVHRIAWACHFGYWPEKHIDHINGDRTDNRICNLREASDAENRQNQNVPHRDNRLGFQGVIKPKRSAGYTASIGVNRRTFHLGTFPTPEDAHAAYVQAKKSLHPFSTLCLNEGNTTTLEPQCSKS